MKTRFSSQAICVSEREKNASGGSAWKDVVVGESLNPECDSQ